MQTSFYQHSFHDLQGICRDNDLVPDSSRHLYNWYYKKNRRELCAIHNLADKTKDYILNFFNFSLPQIHTVHESKDKTVKFLLSLDDGHKIETVLIPFQNKYTICLSSQVGCAMSCTFCYTGKQGYLRNLKTEEIVGQFLQAQKWLTEHRPNDDRILNIVFMGQGEPLHNFEAVKKSCDIFLSQYGLSIACHKITVSTSGYLPGLERWKNEMPNVNIALSLHSPFNHKRNQLIPINKRYPLEAILPLVDSIPQDDKRFVTYEYLLAKDFNDSAEDAHTTGQLLKGKKAYVNLIPFNPFPGAQFERPSDSRIDEFKKILDSYLIPTLIRTTKGDEILAACGQLNTSNPLAANSRPQKLISH